ncbi:hypothetical protein [Botrimarina mediterranea]|uniref:Uncharacterized protein n=1 Tax=Botrimarina mediterranea TaxID=2528022 RepID=A0A518K9P2_9BACT|nr:hypothetical protein [Botrimarina mediterranea]QDV74517.1 hypothetical protein Spa11_27210 [Botrimarina mediterranea]QDV79157.1 hypothetical protein K2D_27680 [Planctomycetes bacterium K2D]
MTDNNSPVTELRDGALRLHDTRPDWIAWAEDLMGTSPDDVV